MTYLFLTDVDECNGTNPCQQGCNNLPGSFQCTCLPGFQPINSTHCEGKEYTTICWHFVMVEILSHADIDECEVIGRCHQVCNNTIGSSFCSCNEGFVLMPDNITCAGKLKQAYVYHLTVH